LCKLGSPDNLINITIKKKCGLIPQIFFADFCHRTKQINNYIMNFVTIIPKKVARVVSSIKILISGGIGSGYDVINGVKRHVHDWNLLAFDVFIIAHIICIVNKFEC